MSAKQLQIVAVASSRRLEDEHRYFGGWKPPLREKRYLRGAKGDF